MNCVVDAHQHFWTYGTYQTSWMEVPPYAGDLRFQPLRRSFQPDDLMPELKAAGVHCTVTIEVRRHGHPLFYSGRTLHPTFLLDCGEQFSVASRIIGSEPDSAASTSVFPVSSHLRPRK